MESILVEYTEDAFIKQAYFFKSSTLLVFDAISPEVLI